MTPARATLAAVVACLVVSLFAGTQVAPANAATPATITAPTPVRAPMTNLGGIVSPYVACARPKQKPHVMWTLNDVATGWQPTYAWTGAIANAKFPRVAPGTYISTTSVTCKGHQTVRTQTVVVPRKTRSTTISKHEFGRIAHGMKRTTVSRIVGYAGAPGPVTGRKRTVVYDRNAFQRTASVRFRRGRVVDKHWNAS